MIDFIRKILHVHKWSSCSEDLVDDMGCFEYEATCAKCGAKEILGGTLHPTDLNRLQFRRKKTNDRIWHVITLY